MDRSDKHSEAELKAMGLPQLKIELKKAIDANDNDYFKQVNTIFYEQQMNKANAVNDFHDADHLNATIKTKYEEIQKMPESTPDEQDAYLFHRVPNYLTLLEQTTIEFLSDYLS